MSNERKPETVTELYPSKYLKASDLAGKRYTLTVESAEVEKLRQFDGSQAWKVILAFEKADKRLILNKTQCKAMVQITGSEHFETWEGTVIQLSPATAHNGKSTIVIKAANQTEKEKEKVQSGTPSTASIPLTSPTTNGYHAHYQD